MIILDYAFGEAQTESPATFLCGKARFEHLFELMFGNAFSGVAYVDHILAGTLVGMNRDFALVADGIQRIFQQILEPRVN